MIKSLYIFPENVREVPFGFIAKTQACGHTNSMVFGMNSVWTYLFIATVYF